MRWMKHLSTSADDEALSALIDKFGLEGYGFWWRMLEIIAQQMDGSSRCSVRYSTQKWAADCRVSPRKFQSLVKFLAELGKIELLSLGEYTEIRCRNLLKYKDEYAQKSGQTPDKCRDNVPSKRTETETEIETERDPETHKPRSEANPEKRRARGNLSDSVSAELRKAANQCERGPDAFHGEIVARIMACTGDDPKTYRAWWAQVVAQMDAAGCLGEAEHWLGYTESCGDSTKDLGKAEHPGRLLTSRILQVCRGKHVKLPQGPWKARSGANAATG